MEWDSNKPDPTKALLDRAQAQVDRQIASGYLERHGLRILDRGWTGQHGALDIVADERRVLVVCQIKRRPARTTSPLEKMSRAKIRRLRRLAAAWLAAHGVAYDEVRVDVVGLTKDPGGGFAIEHVRGVA